MILASATCTYTRLNFVGRIKWKNKAISCPKSEKFANHALISSQLNDIKSREGAGRLPDLQKLNAKLVPSRESNFIKFITEKLEVCVQDDG